MFIPNGKQNPLGRHVPRVYNSTHGTFPLLIKNYSEDCVKIWTWESDDCDANVDVKINNDDDDDDEDNDDDSFTL